MLNSYISDIKAVNADSQAINGYNGAGPFTIENNYLEGAGENVLFGGADPAVTNLVPSNIVLRRNHLFKPLAWRNADPGGARRVRARSAGSGGALAVRHALLPGRRGDGDRHPDGEFARRRPRCRRPSAAGGRVTVSWARCQARTSTASIRGTDRRRPVEVPRHHGDSSLTYTGSGRDRGNAGVERHEVGREEHPRAEERPARDRRRQRARELLVGRTGRLRHRADAPQQRLGSMDARSGRDASPTTSCGTSPACVNIAGFDDSDPTLRTERITFRNNLFDDVNHTAYGTSAKALLVGDGAATLVFDRNTHHSHQQLRAVCLRRRHARARLHEQHLPASSLRDHGRRRHHRASRRSPGTFPAAIVRCNVLAGGTASLYPTPNAFPSVAAMERLVRRCRRPATTG